MPEMKSVETIVVEESTAGEKALGALLLAFVAAGIGTVVGLGAKRRADAKKRAAACDDATSEDVGIEDTTE